MLTLTIQPLDKDLEYTIRKIKGIKWSGTYKVWYLPLSRANYQLLADTLKGKASLDIHLLKQYLEQRKSV